MTSTTTRLANPTPLFPTYRPRVEYTNHGFGYFVSADGLTIKQVMILSHPAFKREERYAAEFKGKIIADAVKIGERLFVSERLAVEEALRLATIRADDLCALVNPLVVKRDAAMNRVASLRAALDNAAETRAS